MRRKEVSGTDVSLEYQEYLDFLQSVKVNQRVLRGMKFRKFMGIFILVAVLISLGTGIILRNSAGVFADAWDKLSMFYIGSLIVIILLVVLWELSSHLRRNTLMQDELELPADLTTIEKRTQTKEYDILGVDIANSGDDLEGHLITSYPMSQIYILLENHKGEVAPVAFQTFLSQLGYKYNETYLRDVSLVKSSHPATLTITTGIPDNKYIERYLRGHGYGDYSITISAVDKAGDQGE